MDSKKIMKDILDKVKMTSGQIGAGFPHAAKDGKYNNMKADWWTNGHWGGILWLAYLQTKDESYFKLANELEEKLDVVIAEHTPLHHDVGFMWLLTSGANYSITDNEKSKKRLLNVASTLAGRFNIKGNFIRAWNGEGHEGWAIIDCMMNIPLLYWASNQTGDPRFKHIAMAHADMVLENFLREDGSSKHICSFDPETGEYIENLSGQGYATDSAWSRGASWALHGMALSYAYTKEKRYLDAAERVAKFFVNQLNADHVPAWDFSAPNKEITDTSAGACAASGLLEIAKYAEDKEYYINAAKSILEGMYLNYSNFDNDKQNMLEGATGFLPNNENIMVGLIYGDYYFFEAISKLCDMEMNLLWEKGKL